MITPNVFAIVVTYNGSSCLKDCINSLQNSTHPVSVIIIDNGSTDKTLSILKFFSDITVLQNGKNLGFSQANNIGIRYALFKGADFVFLLNQDANISSNTITELIRSAEKNKDFGIIAPIQLNHDGTQIDTNFLYSLSKAQPDFFSDLYCKTQKSIYSTSFINAAAWLVSRECLSAVGGFDPIFFMYGEDNDYCNRMIFHNLKIGIVPTAVVFHSRINSAIKNPKRVDIKMRSHLQMSTLLPILKHPTGSFSRHIISVNIAIIFKILDSLLRKRDIRDLISIIISVIKLTINLPQIWKHRKLTRTRGYHWISGEPL
jgi:GT2 family glycosyltransferase